MLFFNIIRRNLLRPSLCTQDILLTPESDPLRAFPFRSQLRMLLDFLSMRLDDLDYNLPPEQIAQRPLDRRDASRLLLLARSKGSLEDRLFVHLPDLLRGDELIVLNNTRVIPARLFGRRAGMHAQPPSRSTRKEHLTGKVEVFLTRQLDPQTWEALVRPGRKMQTGERVLFGEGELEAEVISRGELGLRTLRFVSRDTRGVAEHLERLGHIPLAAVHPSRRMKTPTASVIRRSLQNSPAPLPLPPPACISLRKFWKKFTLAGWRFCELTLDVGLGTFQPVHSETLEDHVMHAEAYEIPAQTAQRIHGSARRWPSDSCRRHYRRPRA